MRTFSRNPAAYKNFRTLWKSARWAIILTWLTDKKLLLGVITGHVIQSLTPVGMALTARGLVNAVVSIVNTDMQQSNILLFWVVFGLTLAILEATSSFAVTFHKNRLKDELNLKITSDILTHAATLDLLYFEDPHFQNMMQRIRENTAANFSEFVSNTLTIIRNCIQSVSLIGLLIIIEPFIVILLLPVAIVYLVFQWRLAKTHYQVWHSRSVKKRWANYFVAQFTDHALVPEVKLLGLAALFKRKFRTLMREFRDQDRKLYLRSFCINIIFAVLSATAVYMALARVAFRVTEKGLTVGDVAIFGSAATRLRRIIEQTVDAITATLEQTLYISNLIDFFQITPRISTNIGVTLPSSRAEIELNNVTFSYPGSDQPVLQDISLHIQSGETVALVGENGAGKTTLVKLIARLYDPERGSVLFDGHDVRRLSLEYLYSQISFIFQNFNRYEATVSENIAYGDWQKILQTPERIAQIARLSGIHDMIVNMPQGYDTILGRMFGKYTLSGGQWQQIALARAFARDTATLLILDEPTSNLDPRSEYSLFCRFKELARGRTTILISHRFSTVSIADRIFVIDQGQIIEQGSHSELLAQKGLYANLYTLHQLQMSDPAQKTERP